MKTIYKVFWAKLKCNFTFEAHPVSFCISWQRFCANLWQLEFLSSKDHKTSLWIQYQLHVVCFKENWWNILLVHYFLLRFWKYTYGKLFSVKFISLSPVVSSAAYILTISNSKMLEAPVVPNLSARFRTASLPSILWLINNRILKVLVDCFFLW